ncbi:MAG: hypothetical protein AAF555_09685 [Verrucomicrobiota bacterium]
MEIHEFFTVWDWLVVLGYLGLTTWVGHLMRGKQATIRDFFLGGRSLPWPAVSGSLIATEISGVTFIGVPGTLFALEGDFRYLQWALGSILARFLVARFIVPLYYEREIYSPYDYMGQRLGRAAKSLATVMFTVGSILGQGVRVLVAALPLRLVTPLPLEWCIVIIGLFAIGWTLMGGMRTVIWTDVMQFALFLTGGLIALVLAITSLSGGWGEFWSLANQFGRTKLLDMEFGFRAELEFTFWVALLAVPFQNLTAFGVDQLNAQRMFCCRNAQEAGRALVFSSLGQILTLLMLLVGAAIFVFYHVYPMGEVERAFLQTGSETVGGSQVPVPGTSRDYIFPMWIVRELPPGLSGLILAGVFAAAISSLDSILAALSQTTLSLLYRPETRTDQELESMNLVAKSRWLVGAWGLLLILFTLGLNQIREGIPIISLAFGMTSYTMGPLLALLLCSILGRGRVPGLVVGFVISFLLVMLVRVDVWVLLFLADFPVAWAAALPTLEMNDAGDGVRALFCYAWAWPVTTAVTFACGWFWPEKERVSQ